MLTTQQKESYHRDGFLILPRFVSEEMCMQLMQRANELIHEFEPSDIKTIFSAKDQRHAKNKYFIESEASIHFFFEEGAINEQGQLIAEKANSINKIGHALHDLDLVFNQFSRMDTLASIVKDLDIEDPLLLQSMYICKQPYIGGEVTCHQDSTYLYMQEQPVVGLWFALEEATLANGCLWAIPGGHHIPLKSRSIRDVNNNITTVTYDTSPWPLDKMEPLEVPQGSLVILHGLLPHMSKENTSPHSRQAYTLHVISGQYEYAKDNWLQRPISMPLRGFV